MAGPDVAPPLARGERLNIVEKIAGWFMPARPDAMEDQAIRDRLMVQICLITSAYSLVYVATSLAIGYAAGAALMTACFLLILALLLSFKAGGRYRLTGNLFLADCLFVAILGCSYFSGGSLSPVTKWAFIIPVCSVILLGFGRDTLAWLAVSSLILVAMPAAGTAGHPFPELYDLRYKTVFAAICDLGLLTILFLAAAAFHANREAQIAGLKQAEKVQQEANRRITQALELQQKAIQEQRNFLAMVSHEFRTPLGIISGAASVLSVTQGLAVDAHTETDKVFRAVRRLERMIDMLMDDSWLEVADAEFRHAPVDLAELIRAVTADMSDAAPGRPVRCLVAAEAEVNGERKMLAIALGNLLGNADKYSPPAQPIDIHLDRRDGMAEIRVVNCGAGIEAADLPRVFEKYYRSSTVEHTTGTGLGLYLVKRIVEHHGGSVGVDSAPGRGATFTLRLPLLTPPASDAARR